MSKKLIHSPADYPMPKKTQSNPSKSGKSATIVTPAGQTPKRKT